LKIQHSIKLKVFAFFSGLTVTLFLAYTAVSIAIAYAVEDELINQLLVTEAHHLRTQYNQNSQLTELITPRLDYMKVYTSLAAMPVDFIAEIERGSREREVFTDSGEHFHYRQVTLKDGVVIYLVAEVSQLLVVTNMSSGILIFAFIVLLITLILSIWFTYLVSKRTIRPLIDLTSAIKGNELNNQKNPLPFYQSKDEMGYLAQTLQHNFDRLNDALLREADFTRDVSHELRTPLTVISNTLALGENRALSSFERLELQQQTNKLKAIIEVLMTLARAESITANYFPLRAHIEECILAIHTKLEEKQFLVTLDIDDNISLLANEQLLNLLIINLLENALQYAASPKLKIRATTSSIIFENDLDKSINEQAMSRNVKQSDSVGMGQGLYLVQRIVDALHWQCQLEHSQNNFRLTVTFLNNN